MSASERRDSARTAVVWDALGPVLGQPGLDVLDIGGGTGGFAVRVAGLGHRVTVVDPSPDALAALARRAREDGVEVAGQQGDLGSLLELAGAASADVVLCHGVLEVVEDPATALAAIREVLRPDGRLSLLVAQRHAAVIARAMAGHLTQALALLEDHRQPSTQPIGRTGQRFTAEEVTGLLAAAGFEVGSVHGIRVFADLVPGALLDLEPGTAAALLELERAVSERPEYLPLATQIHLLATR
jgi:2-polyprenyl-3-methyl-5-hydroxy-6-metoxy-1,4-benzoquinol methylase